MKKKIGYASRQFLFWVGRRRAFRRRFMPHFFDGYTVEAYNPFERLVFRVFKPLVDLEYA